MSHTQTSPEGSARGPGPRLGRPDGSTPTAAVRSLATVWRHALSVTIGIDLGASGVKAVLIPEPLRVRSPGASVSRPMREAGG